MQGYKKIILNVRYLWLLMLPLAAITSWLLNETPVAIGVNRYSNFINKSYDDKNFYQLEQFLNQLYAINTNKIMIDAQAEKYLSQAVSRFGAEYDQILFEKTFPSPEGKRLGQLLRCYQEYKNAEAKISQRYLSAQAGQYVLDYRALQKVFFAGIAKNLFADHHQVYQSIEVAGMELISPPLTGVAVAPVCTEIYEAAND